MTKFKTVCLLTLVGVLTTTITNTIVANAAKEEGLQPFDGPFLYQGSEFTMFMRTSQDGGYVEEYTSAENFCSSWLVLPGTSLLSTSTLGIMYLLVLFYIFLGVAVIADLFMEAIEVITSKVQVVDFVDDQGAILKIEKPVWNPTIANLTLMALGSSAPEILLSVISTVSAIEETPSELGPQSIVGSAAFNLHVISAVSIMSVVEIKKIADMGVFIVTATASTFAYFWFFLVLTVISKDVVELWEALLTIGFFFILVILAYGADRVNAKKLNNAEDKVKKTQDVAKCALRIMAKRLGNFKILEAAQGHKPDRMSVDDIENIEKHYKTVLKLESLDKVSLDEFLDVLNPENPLERILYRKKAAKLTTNRLEFVKLAREEGQHSH